MVEWPQTNDALAAYHVYAVELAAEMSKEPNPQATFLLRGIRQPRREPQLHSDVPLHRPGRLRLGGGRREYHRRDAKGGGAGPRSGPRRRWKTSKHTGADLKSDTYYLEKHGKFFEKRTFEYYDIESYRLEGWDQT